MPLFKQKKKKQKYIEMLIKQFSSINKPMGRRSIVLSLSAFAYWGSTDKLLFSWAGWI